MFQHPVVEVTYDEDETYSEEYKVFVDENCQSCHTDITIQERFNPDSYTSENEWAATPWWLDENYKSLFGDGASDSQEENQVTSPSSNQTNFIFPQNNANQYMVAPSTTGDTSSSNSQILKSTTTDSSQVDNDYNTIDQRTSSKVQNKKVKRKFKKRI